MDVKGDLLPHLLHTWYHNTQ